jgi:aryl-alcohol dehydrogenase-like predicted oxidoreductase
MCSQANVYSNGASEEIIGKAIKKYNIPRHKLVILSKCHGTVGEEHKVRGFFYPKEMAKSKDYVNQGGEAFFDYYPILDLR